MKLLIIYFVFALIHSSLSHGKHAGVKVRISKVGLNYGAKLGIDMLGDAILPDYCNDGFELNNIKMSFAEKPTADVTLNPGKGLTATFNNASIDLEAHWKYNVGSGWFQIRDSGCMTMSLKGFSISVALEMNVDEAGRLTASASSCSCSLQDFNINFNGSLSFLYNLYVGMFKAKILEKIPELACIRLMKRINANMSDEDAFSYEIYSPITSKIKFDCHLTEKPIFTSEYAEISQVGEFFSEGIRLPGILDGAAVPTLNINANDKMVSMVMCERLFNSGAYVLQKLGCLNFTRYVEGPEVSKLLKIQNDRLYFDFAANEPPTIRITTSQIICNLTASLNIYSGGGSVSNFSNISNTSNTSDTSNSSNASNDSNTRPLASFQVGMVVRTDLFVANNRFNGRYIDIEPSVLDGSIALPDVPTKDVQAALKLLMGTVLPHSNGETSTNFTIPMDMLYGIDFRGLQLIKSDGALTALADLTMKW